MIDVYLAQDDGTIVTQNDGTPIILYSYQPQPPAAPAYTAADFASALLSLLPSGRVWPRDAGATLPAVAAGLAPTYARLSDRAAALLQDAPAGRLDEQLTPWEITLGLPDPCLGATPTVAARRKGVLAQIGARGGQSASYFIGLAEALGYTVSVQEFAPARFGVARFGDRLYGKAWANAWRVTLSAGSIQSARYGSARYGDRYRTWGNGVLECQLNAIKPAHTILLFSYTDPGAVTAALLPPYGTFILGRNTLA